MKNMISMLDNLSLSRFRAFFRALQPVELPSFAGSTFRGALGHAMRKVRYQSKEICRKCPAHSECRYGSLYTYFFESPWDHPFIGPAHDVLNPKMQRETYPQPFILEPPSGGSYAADELLVLEFTLIGKAISFFPFMACTLIAMGIQGVGRGRAHTQLEIISNGFTSKDGKNPLIYDAKVGEMATPAEVIDFNIVHRWAEEFVAAQNEIGEIRINFLTPFRYKYQGKLGQPLTFEILVRNLLRRFTLLSVHSPLPVAIDHERLLLLATSVQVKSSNLRWRQLARYSLRQKTWMNLDGFVGEMTFAGDLVPFLPYLKMGEYLNVGKDGSFGLGKYEMSLAPMLA